MKILVDEMPKNGSDCVFGTGYDQLCVIDNKSYCPNSSNCQFLEPITNYHVNRVVGETPKELHGLHSTETHKIYESLDISHK